MREPQLAGELRGGGQHLVRWHPVKAGVQYAGEAASRRRLPGRVEEQVDGVVLGHLDGEEQRALAFRYRLEQVAVVGVAAGQSGQVLGELQQQLEPVFVAY